MKKDKQLTALIEKELSKPITHTFYDFHTKKMVKAKITSTYEEGLKKVIYQIAQKYAEMKVEEVRGKGYAIEMKDFTNKLKQNK